MKKLFLVASLCTVGMIGNDVAAQEQCGLDVKTRELVKQNPQLAMQIQDHSLEFKQKAEDLAAGKTSYAMKTTNGPVVIPIVFHVILNQSQLDGIGGTAGVYNRVTTQMDVLNWDYNARNQDSSKIPPAFLSFFGNPQISFSLAHTDPNGKATDGIEIRVAASDIAGFDQSNSYIKRSAYGGLDPWDNTKYLNVWVININDDNLLGFGYSPYYADKIINDKSQMGVVIDFGAFGVKPVSSSFYWHPSANKGRTLTHELGHFFNLWHTWGKGAVGSGTCQDDDDVSDTPRQFDATTGSTCKSFPEIDACTSSGNGIMYMNYMDYSGDNCTHMFSKGQATRMQVEVSPGGDSYGLTIHPELTMYPTGTANIEKENFFNIFPNPSNGVVNIDFTGNTDKLQSISILSSVGQLVKHIDVTDKSQMHFSVDLSGVTKGIYMVQVQSEGGKIVRKVMIQ